MAEPAIKAKDLRSPEHAARIERKRERSALFVGKKFEDLDAAGKDALLKAVAIRLGLIQDS